MTVSVELLLVARCAMHHSKSIEFVLLKLSGLPPEQKWYDLVFLMMMKMVYQIFALRSRSTFTYVRLLVIVRGMRSRRRSSGGVEMNDSSPGSRPPPQASRPPVLPAQLGLNA